MARKNDVEIEQRESERDGRELVIIIAATLTLYRILFTLRPFLQKLLELLKHHAVSCFILSETCQHLVCCLYLPCVPSCCLPLLYLSFYVFFIPTLFVPLSLLFSLSALPPTPLSPFLDERITGQAPWLSMVCWSFSPFPSVRRTGTIRIYFL